jgi:hypothetical protein
VLISQFPKGDLQNNDYLQVSLAKLVVCWFAALEDQGLNLGADTKNTNTIYLFICHVRNQSLEQEGYFTPSRISSLIKIAWLFQMDNNLLFQLPEGEYWIPWIAVLTRFIYFSLSLDLTQSC